MDQHLLRAEEVATLLRLGRSKTYELMADGTLLVVRIGKSIRVPAGALQTWIESQTEAQRVEHEGRPGAGHHV